MEHNQRSITGKNIAKICIIIPLVHIFKETHQGNMIVWKNRRRMHLSVEEWVGDKDLNFFGGTRVTEAIAQLRWERTWQKDDSFDILSWPVFGRVDREEEGDSFDLFFQVLTESHAKKMEPEVKQLFSCVRSESNRRFFKFSIPSNYLQLWENSRAGGS